jgi:hypothetical protein
LRLFECLIILRTCRAQPVCLPVIQVQAHALNQTTLKQHWQFFYCCLAAPLSVPGLPACAPRRGCWRLAGGFSCFWSASPDLQQPRSAVCSPAALSPSQQHSTCCKLACERLGLQVGASMMSCKTFKQSCQVQVQGFYQRDKRRADLA